VAGTGPIRTGDLVVFVKPVAVAPAVVRRDGLVQAAGHAADHARLGLAEDLLDELCGNGGTIDEIARQPVLEGKVNGAARRALTPALAVRFTLLTLTPDADYAEVMALLLGDLPLVPGHRHARRPPSLSVEHSRDHRGYARSWRFTRSKWHCVRGAVAHYGCPARSRVLARQVAHTR
jgi:hypothetical protein